MPSLRQFLNSPLARHPGLLTRKVAARLGWSPARLDAAAPPMGALSYPAHWAPALRDWVKQVPLRPAPHSFGRVFQQEFPEPELLRLCRSGPRREDTGLPGDIKLIWDYSRAQALFTNIAADPASVELCAAFVRRWLEANRDVTGPAWTCPMELSIRGINWAWADALAGGELGRRVGSAEWSAWLFRHGHGIWQGLEARAISSNHYLADLLGLFIIGSALPEDKRARAWARFARHEFPLALLAQTRRDGGLAEASLRYHAFVTEMALLFRLAQGAPFDSAAEERLRKMCRIIAEFRDATGDVFPLGDDDSGRVLGLYFFVHRGASGTVCPTGSAGLPAGVAFGRADVLLRLAEMQFREPFGPAAEALYPDSGWWVQRAGDFVAALDFGGVGLGGLGGHAHNDDLSFCLEWRGHSVIADPGTFLYTSNVAARNRFRSTAFHNTVIIDRQEQRPLTEQPFSLPGPDQAFAHRSSGGVRTFIREAAPQLRHRREIRLSDAGLTLRDTIQGTGRHHLEWRFHLHPTVEPRLAPGVLDLKVRGAGTLALELPANGVAVELIPSEYSPGYGRLEPTHACAASAEVTLPYEVTWRITRPPNT